MIDPKMFTLFIGRVLPSHLRVMSNQEDYD